MAEITPVQPVVGQMRGLRKAYNLGQLFETEVLHGLDLSVHRGEFCAVVGPSGSGKSTLLDIVGLLDRPTSGTLEVCGEQTTQLDDRALTRLRGHSIGLTPWQDNLAGKLSGGQQQRVAFARALAMGPALLLADEPTGNLDTKSADEVFALLRQFNTEHGTTVLFVTHNADLARRCDKTIEVIDGRLTG